MKKYNNTLYFESKVKDYKKHKLNKKLHDRYTSWDITLQYNTPTYKRLRKQLRISKILFIFNTTEQ